MPKNKIQFQPGLSLFEFLELYGTEQQCRATIFKFRWPFGFICPKCSGKKHYALKSRHLHQCATCRHQTSLISDTVFEATKLSLTVWFLGIYLITQSKDGISSLNLSRTLGISANAALRMKHKLQHTMKQRDDSQSLRNFVQIDDAYIGGIRRGGKRGRGSENKTPFIAAIMTNEKGNPLFMRFSEVTAFTKHEVTGWAKKHLTPGTQVVSDGLNCFPGVVEAGCLHHVIITGGGPDSVDIPEFKWVNTMIGNVKNSIRGTYHSISDKHIPRYLAEFCFRFNRRFHLDRMVEQLIHAAVKTSPIPQRILKLAEVRW